MSFLINRFAYVESKLGQAEGQPVFGGRTIAGSSLSIPMRLVPGNKDISSAGPVDRCDILSPVGKLYVADQYVCPLHYGSPSVGLGFYESGFTFEAYLGSREIEAIETIRNGGELTLTVSWWGNAWVPASTHPANPVPGSIQAINPDRVTRAIPQSHWTKVLEGMGYARRMLVEVPVPESAGDPSMVKAVAFLAKAQDKTARGEYREAVAHCRESLEELAAACGDAANPKLQVLSGDLFKNTIALAKEERIACIRHAARVFCHPAHHAGSAPVAGIPAHEYTRADAQAIVTIVSVLIAQCGKER